MILIFCEIPSEWFKYFSLPLQSLAERINLTTIKHFFFFLLNWFVIQFFTAISAHLLKDKELLSFVVYLPNRSTISCRLKKYFSFAFMNHWLAWHVSPLNLLNLWCCVMMRNIRGMQDFLLLFISNRRLTDKVNHSDLLSITCWVKKKYSNVFSVVRCFDGDCAMFWLENWKNVWRNSERSATRDTRRSFFNSLVILFNWEKKIRKKFSTACVVFGCIDLRANYFFKLSITFNNESLIKTKHKNLDKTFFHSNKHFLTELISG